MKFFNMDSPLMIALNKMADLMVLNLLTLVCCLPIITVGASLTAMHYTVLKLVRDEESYIIKSFFKSFKQNFRQATVIWLLQLFVYIVLGLDFYLLFMTGTKYNIIFQVILFVVTVVVLLISVFVYPVLCKFDNTILKTLKNAMFIGMLQIPKAILMLLMFVAPPLVALIMPQVIPVVLLYGLTAPAYGGAKLYNKFFEKMESQLESDTPSAQELSQGDEHIFSDEPLLPPDDEQ